MVVFGGLIWLAVYAYQEGFTKKWKRLITEEFRKHDLHIRFDKLTIDPFQGLIANHVVLLKADTNQEVARVSKARLDLDLAKFFQKEPFLERIKLESADLALPFDLKNSPSKRLELKDLNATIILTKDRLEIAHARTHFYGLQLQLTGSLLRPETPTPGAPLFDWKAGKLNRARPVLERLITELDKLEIQDQSPPLVDLTVSGDLSHPESLVLTAHLQSGPIHYETYECESIEAEAVVTHEQVEVASLTLTDLQGRFNAIGEFPLDDDRPARVSVDSSIDLGQLLAILTPDLFLWDWLSLPIPPTVRFEGTLQLDQPFSWSAPPVDIVGHAGTEGLRLGEEFFQHLSTDFHIQGPRLFLRNMALRHHQGESTGKWLYTPEEGIRYEAALGIDPSLLADLPLTEPLQQFLDHWQFDEESEVQVEVSGQRKGSDTTTWDHRGRATLKQCQYRSAGIDHLSADFQLNPHAYHFSNVDLQLAPDEVRGYSGGSVNAQRVSVSVRESLTMLTDLTGRVDPGQVVRCFNENTADELDRFRFDRPPEIRIPRGTIDPEGISQTNLQVEVKAAGTMTTTVFGKPLPLDHLRFGMLFHKENLIVRAEHAGLFGGSLAGNLDIRHLSTSREYTAEIDLTEVEFNGLGALYFPDHRCDGQLTGDLSWRGQDRDLDAVVGKGVVHLLNSRELEVPVLGPLSSLTALVVGKTQVSHDLVEDLGLRFSVASSRLNLEAIAGDLGAYAIRGQGEVDLETEAVDIKVSLMSQSATTAVLDVLYEVFGTYRCTGTLERPRWRLVQRFRPADLLKAVEALGDSTKVLSLEREDLRKLDPGGILSRLFSRDRRAEEPVEPGDTRTPPGRDP